MQVINWIILGASLITAVTTICTFIQKAINKSLEKTLKSIDKRIDELDKKIEELDRNQCKNYLVTFLNAKKKGLQMTEIENQRAYEVYDHYTFYLKGNSWLHDDWEKLMK